MKLRIEREEDDSFWLDAFEIKQTADSAEEFATLFLSIMKATLHDPETIVEALVPMVLCKEDLASLLRTYPNFEEDADDEAETK